MAIDKKNIRLKKRDEIKRKGGRERMPGNCETMQCRFATTIDNNKGYS